MLQGGFEHGRVLESDDAFANDAVAVQENRSGDAQGRYCENLKIASISSS